MSAAGLVSLHRERYTQASRLLRDLSAHSQMRRPALVRSASRTLRLGKLIYAQLRADRPESQTHDSPRPELDAALEVYTARITELQRQLRVVDRIRDRAEELADVLEGLPRDPDGAAEALRGLVRRIACDTRDAAYGAQLLPWGSDVPNEPADDRAVDCCSGPVIAATVAAWTATHFHIWSQHAELLTAAALVQDAGLYFWKRLRGIAPNDLSASRPDDYRNHPKVGAAFVGPMRKAWAMLPRVVATHHERLDRRGFPARMPPGLLTPTLRYLPVINRFCELFAGTMPDEDDPSPSGLESQSMRGAVEATAMAILDEAERGAWDVPLARAVLAAFDAEPIHRWEDPLAARAPALSEFGHRRLRRDAPHLGPPVPHVSGIVSGGESRRVMLSKRPDGPAAIRD